MESSFTLVTCTWSSSIFRQRGFSLFSFSSISSVSRVMAFITILALSFFCSTVSTISVSLPLLPPIKTWVGAGSSCKASGASPLICKRLDALCFLAFSPVRAYASSFFSIAYTFPSVAQSRFRFRYHRRYCPFSGLIWLKTIPGSLPWS